MERRIEMLEELGSYSAVGIESISKELEELKSQGYICYYDNNKDEIVLDDIIGQYFVIRKDEHGRKEKVFRGTLKEAIELQDFFGIEEVARIKLEDIESFDELIKINFFGDDEYLYEVVTVEEYFNTPNCIME